MATAYTIFNKAASTGYNFSALGAAGTPVWLPQIYSKKILSYFRRALVAEAVCNTDYYGELNQFGDTVNIIKEPVLTVNTYTRTTIGGSLTGQEINPDATTLTIDRAKYFQFEVEDLEKEFSHINWQSVAASSAAYALAKAMDLQVFQDMVADVKTSAPDNKWGADISTVTHTTPYALATGTGYGALAPNANPIEILDLLSLMARYLDDQDIPEEGRWVVAPPLVYEALASSASKLMSVDYNQGDGGLRNGLVASGQLRGFKLYKSTALNTGNAATNTSVIIAGHMSAVATASALTKVETMRNPSRFTDIVRGLLVWGTKVLRPEAIIVAHVLNK